MNPADVTQTALAPQAHGVSFIELFLQASPTVQFVMSGLLLASIWSWAIIFEKLIAFRRARVEAPALLQTLNADLLTHDSATLTLDRWCGAHRLASPARIVAERVHGAEQAPTAEQRQLLGVSATELVRFRKVRLRCGDHVLSEADNWYVPTRLTPEMNRVLDTTDTAFGRAVKVRPRG